MRSRARFVLAFGLLCSCQRQPGVSAGGVAAAGAPSQAGMGGLGGAAGASGSSASGAGGGGTSNGGTSMMNAPDDFLAVGPYASCVIRKGKLACFGRCGSASNGGSRDSAPPGLDATTVAVGRDFACAILQQPERGNRLRCWGEGAAAAAPSVPDVAQLSAADTYACAAAAAGAVTCWGGGAPTPPVDISAKALASSGAMTCAITADDSVRCFGAHVAEPPADLKAKRVAVASQLADALQGPRFGCAVTSTDTVRCWGDEVGGVQQVPPGLLAREIAVGRAQACAITTTDDVRCWGTAPRYGAPLPKGLKARSLSMAFRTAGVVALDGSFSFWGDVSDGRGALPPEQP